ncbi:MAG: UvrD-helicase domain-containing protein [Minicystis sp.]
MSIGLNPSQTAAVEHEHGPMLVLAGAGSGKTRVVTHRIARMIGRGTASRSILAVTFTNKAAAEMRERVTSLVGLKVAKDLHVSTFHRFGLDVLGAETRALGLRGTSFAVFDAADQAGVVREILREIRTGKAYDIGAILARLSNAKNAFLTAEEWEDQQRKGKGIDNYDEIAMLVYPRYQAALRSFQAFDFDDLICEVVNLWRRRPDVLARWQQRFRQIIVDEYQDTNHAQLELVRLLGGEHRNVMVVGDDDQSIYAWRGADVRNILDFEEHFAGAKVVKLEENYRSVKPILDVANAALAASSARRHGKVLRATRQSEDRVELVVCADPDVEASYVGAGIQKLVEQEGVRPKEIAVLYRSNLQAQAIESALKERTIPIRMIGGQQFFERKEVKDLIAYLKVILNPHDEMSLRRIINYPSRGIGDVAVSKLGAWATANDAPLWAAVCKPHAVRDLPPAAMEGCRALVRLVEAMRLRLDSFSPASVARALVGEIGLKEDIMAGSTNPQAAARRWGNVEGLLNVFFKREEQGKGDRARFAEFLRLLALRADGDEEEATDRVTLTTVHGAKGLEWRYVFLIGLEEGLIPHARTLDDRATDATPDGDAATSIEEERRLFYVAVTRARDKLFMSRCKVRGMRGKLVPRTPSRFLMDIPPELYDEREEVAPVAPELEKVKAGAAGVLAAILGEGGGTGEIPFIPRPMARPGQQRRPR